jgi:hypothetical protein
LAEVLSPLLGSKMAPGLHGLEGRQFFKYGGANRSPALNEDGEALPNATPTPEMEVI